jgi:hypothetical protein
VKDPVQNLARRDLKVVALVAFAIGVLLHVCVAYAVLGDSGPDKQSDRAAPGAPGAAPAQQTARTTPTVLPDRRSCDEIRGSQYRSDSERLWFLQNCTSG